jgi:phage tail sheath gpL-like
MSISFLGIPADLRRPGAYIEIDNSRAIQGLSIWPARALLVGQMLSGLAVAGVPVRITSTAQARTLFGRGSHLAQQAEAWFRANGSTEAWAMGVADNSEGTAAGGTLAFSGTASAAGTLALLIGGRRVDVAVASGTTAANVAAAVNTAINAALDLPVTSTVSTATVTLAARHKGTIGNAIHLAHSWYEGEALPAGITLTITAMASGAGDPDAGLTTALAGLGDEWFTDLVLGWSAATTMAVVEAHLLSEWGPLRMRDAIAWAMRADTFSNLATYGAARNSPLLTVGGMRGSPTLPWEFAAAYGGVAIPAMATDPARPVQTLALPGVIAPKIADRFTDAERELLLRDGITTFTTGRDGVVRIERAITTYQTSAAGADDVSFLDVNTLKTLAYLRYDVRQLFAQRYPRHKLADDGTRFAQGQVVATPGTIKAELVARALQWEAAGLVENIEQFKRELIVRRSDTDRTRVDIRMPPDLVNQLRVIAAQIQFIL